MPTIEECARKVAEARAACEAAHENAQAAFAAQAGAQKAMDVANRELRAATEALIVGAANGTTLPAAPQDGSSYTITAERDRPLPQPPLG